VASSHGHGPAGRALLFAAGALLAGFLSGCRATSGSGPVDTGALEQELEEVIHLRLLSAGSLDREVEVTCTRDATVQRRFSCLVVTAGPGEEPRTWSETVLCREERSPETPRCYTRGGDALQ
jgi:hypothetical protein